MSRENRSQAAGPARYPRTAPAPVAPRRPAPQAASAEATGPARMTAPMWWSVGIPAAGEAAPSWLDDTPDWHPFP